MAITFPMLAGTLASLLHVVSGPDHLAAVTPLALESEKKAWKVGLLWGLGHVMGMLLIGVLLLLFRSYLPIDKISAYSEFVVGTVLIGIGLWSFYGIFRKGGAHSHPHVHINSRPYLHAHKHEHADSFLSHDHTHSRQIRYNLLFSFGVGVLHGFAGVAHFLLLLPVLGFSVDFEGVQYLIGFGFGTVLAMTAYGLVLGQLSGLSKKGQYQAFFKGVRLTGGLFAIVIGIYWVYNY